MAQLSNNEKARRIVDQMLMSLGTTLPRKKIRPDALAYFRKEFRKAVKQAIRDWNLDWNALRDSKNPNSPTWADFICEMVSETGRRLSSAYDKKKANPGEMKPSEVYETLNAVAIEYGCKPEAKKIVIMAKWCSFLDGAPPKDDPYP